MLAAAIVCTDLGGVLRLSGTDDRYAVGPPKYSSSIEP